MNSANEPERSAGVVLYRFRPDDQEPEFLLLRNALHHTWAPPKGHRDDGEDDLETARRETEEETGLRVLEVEPGFEVTLRYEVTSDGRRRSKEVVYFLAPVPEGALRRSHEHDAHDWVTLEEARHVVRHEDLLDLLARARRRLCGGDDA